MVHGAKTTGASPGRKVGDRGQEWRHGEVFIVRHLGRDEAEDVDRLAASGHGPLIRVQGRLPTPILLRVEGGDEQDQPQEEQKVTPGMQEFREAPHGPWRKGLNRFGIRTHTRTHRRVSRHIISEIGQRWRPIVMRLPPRPTPALVPSVAEASEGPPRVPRCLPLVNPRGFRELQNATDRAAFHGATRDPPGPCHWGQLLRARSRHHRS